MSPMRTVCFIDKMVSPRLSIVILRYNFLYCSEAFEWMGHNFEFISGMRGAPAGPESTGSGPGFGARCRVLNIERRVPSLLPFAFHLDFLAVYLTAC